MMLLQHILIYIVRCVSHAWGIFLSDALNLYSLGLMLTAFLQIKTTPICTGRANTSDVPISQQ